MRRTYSVEGGLASLQGRWAPSWDCRWSGHDGRCEGEGNNEELHFEMDLEIGIERLYVGVDY
jgi:hypothetical protein